MEPCSGDSGGPLYPLERYTNKPICLYGIVSHGNEFACDGPATLFQRVSSELDWIKQIMEEFQICIA